MKNLIITAIVFLIGGSVEMNASNGDNTSSKHKTRSAVEKSGSIGIGLDVDFGKRRRGCEGRGICSVRLTIVTDDTPLGRYAPSGNGTLTLTIPLEYISRTQPDKMQNFKGQSEFIVEEDYTLSADVNAKLGAEGTLTLKSGKYPMTLREGILTIVIGDML